MKKGTALAVTSFLVYTLWRIYKKDGPKKKSNGIFMGVIQRFAQIMTIAFFQILGTILYAFSK